MATRIERLPKSHRHVLSGIALVCALLLFEGDVIAAPKGVSFSVPSDQVEAYDYVEIVGSNGVHVRDFEELGGEDRKR